MTPGGARRLTLAPAAGAVSQARHFVRHELDGAGADEDVVETAELLVSELVTNVVLHARTSAVVSVRADPPDAFRVSVIDGSADPPHRRAFGREQPTGRGLRLVSVMARDWGVEPSTAVGRWGKEVWFVVPAELVDLAALAAAYGAADLGTPPEAAAS